MTDASQVPEDILYKTSTKALIETMLSNPYILMFYTSNDSSHIKEFLYETFNIYRELQTRSDYFDSLIEIYENLPIYKNSSELATAEHNYRFFDVFNVEVLIALELYDNGTSRNTKTTKDIVAEEKISELYQEKCELRTTAKDIYSSNSNGFIWFNKNNVGHKDNLQTSLRSQINATIKTPNQTNVSAIIYDEMTAAEIRNYNNYTDLTYPNAIRLHTATARFNCHSYAWYSQNTSNNIYWIPNPSAFWQDGSYVTASAGAGRKVRYLSGEHSAIMYYYSSGEIYYISKWGPAGLFRHAPSYGPSEYKYSSGVSYYKAN